MGDALRVVARLASPLAGDPPQLDSLLLFAASPLVGKAAVPAGYKVDRSSPPPDTSAFPLPLLRRAVGGWNVAMASSPIMGAVTDDRHEYIVKRLAVEHAGDLAPAERRQVNMTGGPLKAYRLPLRVRDVDRIAWLCVGDRREIGKLLKRVPAVGRKVAHGYGRVAEWTVDRLDFAPLALWPWWVAGPDGTPVLMRPLPVGPWLPANIAGCRPDFAACVDPYWHPDRFAEVVVPC